MVADREGAANYYAKEGKIPYQMYYPRTGGYWPLTRFRLLWIWFFEWRNRQKQNPPKFETSEEWAGGLHLPGMQRLFSGGPGAMYTRWCVPVEESLTRVVYFRSRRVRTHVGRFGSGSPLPCIATGCKTTISPTRTTMRCTRPLPVSRVPVGHGLARGGPTPPHY